MSRVRDSERLKEQRDQLVNHNTQLVVENAKLHRAIEEVYKVLRQIVEAEDYPHD